MRHAIRSRPDSPSVALRKSLVFQSVAETPEERPLQGKRDPGTLQQLDQHHDARQVDILASDPQHHPYNVSSHGQAPRRAPERTKRRQSEGRHGTRCCLAEADYIAQASVVSIAAPKQAMKAMAPCAGVFVVPESTNLSRRFWLSGQFLSAGEVGSSM